MSDRRIVRPGWLYFEPLKQQWLPVPPHWIGDDASGISYVTRPPSGQQEKGR